MRISSAIALLGLLVLAGCKDDDASVASKNLSTASDNFEITRRVIFQNGITDKYIMVIEGRCSIKADRADNQLEVTCKVGPNAYKKHFFGLSDNSLYFVEQLEAKDVSVYHYRVIFKPQTIIPDIEFKGSLSG